MSQSQWLLPLLTQDRVNLLVGELQKRYSRTLKATPYSHGYELAGELSNFDHPRVDAFIQGFLASES